MRGAVKKGIVWSRKVIAAPSGQFLKVRVYGSVGYACIGVNAEIFGESMSDCLLGSVSMHDAYE